MEKIRIIAGITEDNEIYIIEIENKNYFSMTGFIVYPYTYQEAKRREKEFLLSIFEDNEEEIKSFNERNGTNFRSPKTIVNYITYIDGELTHFDNSLLPVEIDYKGKTWLFESISCGQVKKEKLKHYFIDVEVYQELMNIWENYHLKENCNIDLSFIPEQNESEILKKAIKLIRKR